MTSPVAWLHVSLRELWPSSLTCRSLGPTTRSSPVIEGKRRKSDADRMREEERGVENMQVDIKYVRKIYYVSEEAAEYSEIKESYYSFLLYLSSTGV